MELKHVWLDVPDLEADCLNRTFMELKLWSLLAWPPPTSRLNRTFMELKQRKAIAAGQLVAGVLIVPLWN